VTFEADGVTFAVDPARSDLLLEAELPRFTEALSAGHGYRITPDSLRRAKAGGMTVADLERWCLQRSGEELSAAARLCYPGERPGATAAREWVVTLADELIADGVAQWPRTAGLIERRVGPTAVVVSEESLGPLRQALAEVGIQCTVEH
jgi:hypothetical protein